MQYIGPMRILAGIAYLYCASLLVLSSIAGPTETVRHEGSMRISSHCSVDLDAGNRECNVILDGDGTQSPGYPSSKDIDFRVEPDGTRLYLRPRNGAQLALCDKAGRTACNSVRYLKQRLRVDDLPQGTHICVQTSQGRYG
jgi:hypothetical protein